MGISKDGKLRNLITGKTLQGTILNTYRSFNLHIDGHQQNIAGHHLVALMFLDNPTNKPYVDHINGVKNDNRLENLELVSQQENMQKASGANAWHFRKVGEFNDKNELLRIFANASAAARAINILPGSMRNSIRRNGKCYNGLSYRYLNT